MLWAWVCICSLSAVAAELLAGTCGLVVPALASASFYFTVVLGWRASVVPLVAAASLTDVLTGHTWPSCVIMTVPVMMLSLLWRRHGDCRHITVQALLGAAIGLGYGGGIVLLEVVLVEAWCWAMVRHGLHTVAASSLCGLVALPFLCHWLDRLAQGLALPRLANARRSEVPDVR